MNFDSPSPWPLSRILLMAILDDFVSDSFVVEKVFENNINNYKETNFLKAIGLKL